MNVNRTECVDNVPNVYDKLEYNAFKWAPNKQLHDHHKLPQ